MFINGPRAQKTPQILWDWDSGNRNSTVENRGRGGGREAGGADLRLTRALSDMEEGGVVGDGQGGDGRRRERKRKSRRKKKRRGDLGELGGAIDITITITTTPNSNTTTSNNYYYYYY